VPRRSIDIENDRMQAFVSHSLWGPYNEATMEKPDPTANGYSRKVQLETGRKQGSDTGRGLAAARATWPQIVIHATREFERQGQLAKQ